MLTVLVAISGAAIEMAELGVIGWVVHCWLLDHAPGVAAWIPRDGGAVLGLLAGAWVVSRWAIN